MIEDGNQAAVRSYGLLKLEGLLKMPSRRRKIALLQRNTAESLDGSDSPVRPAQLQRYGSRSEKQYFRTRQVAARRLYHAERDDHIIQIDPVVLGMLPFAIGQKRLEDAF